MSYLRLQQFFSLTAGSHDMHWEDFFLAFGIMGVFGGIGELITGCFC